MHPLPYRLFILDKDGTLTKCTVPGQPCPNSPGEWDFMPNVVETLSQYNWSRQPGHKVFAMATNQGGVARCFMTEETAHDICQSVIQGLTTTMAAIDNPPVIHSNAFLYDMSTSYKPDDPRRKPNPGMLWELMMDFGVSRFETLFIGDQESDAAAAHNAGCEYMAAHQFFGWM